MRDRPLQQEVSQMSSVTLSLLASQIGLSLESQDVALTGLAIDSRQVKHGDLFAAIEGETANGNDFIDSALANGAAAIISEQPVSHSIPSLRVDNVQRACADFGLLMRRASSATVVGITGSAGKTTAKGYIEQICSRAGSTIATLGNQNNELGVPLTLGRLSTDPEFAVIEMGAAQRGDIAFLARMALPKVVVLLNAFEAHLGRFGSVENIVETKGEILDGLNRESVAVLNADQSHFAAWKERAKPAAILSFGMTPDADVHCLEVVSHGFSGTSITLSICGASYAIRLAVPGVAGIMNALAGAAVGQALGLNHGDIIAGLESLVPVAGRGKTLQLERGIRVVDDSYNASPSSVEAALSVLAATPVPRTAVLGDMLELGVDAVDYHRQVGRHLAACGVERLFCVGDLARYFGDVSGVSTEHFSDVTALIASKPQFDANETILVKGSRGIKLDRFVDSLSESLGEMQC